MHVQEGARMGIWLPCQARTKNTCVQQEADGVELSSFLGPLPPNIRTFYPTFSASKVPQSAKAPRWLHGLRAAPLWAVLTHAPHRAHTHSITIRYTQPACSEVIIVFFLAVYSSYFESPLDCATRKTICRWPAVRDWAARQHRPTLIR